MLSVGYLTAKAALEISWDKHAANRLDGRSDVLLGNGFSAQHCGAHVTKIASIALNTVADGVRFGFGIIS